MIMRATQKKMMSKPVTSTAEGRNVSRSGSCPASRASENGTSCGGEPGVEHVRVAPQRSCPWRFCTRLLLRVRGRRRCCLRRRTTPGSGGPTRAGARCTSPGCSPASGCRSWSSARGRTSPRRASTTSRPSFARPSIFTNHWSVSIGSTTTPVRPDLRHHHLVRLGADQEVLASRAAHDRLARLEAVHALELLRRRSR